MLPAESGLSLIEVDRVAYGYRLGFDESRARYLIRLFGPQGRLLRYLCVYNEAGNPLQSFKLMVEKPDRIAQAD
jgi:hypothetical protein